MMNIVGQEAAAIHTPGAKSGRGAAVGQQAKAAVAAAREGGLDLPKDAQGIAASAIAHGAVPESVFSALVSPPADESDGSTGGVVDGIPTEVGDVLTETVVDANVTEAIAAAEVEANLPPVAVPDGNDISVDVALAAGMSSAEGVPAK